MRLINNLKQYSELLKTNVKKKLEENIKALF